MQPVILEAALNGGTRKTTNPNVPRSTHELVQDAFACLDAGAAIVHTHIDEPGAPAERAAELYAAHFAPILDSRPDALLYPTVGFAKTFEESFAHFPILVERLGLRIGIIDPGCVNLAGFAYVNTPEVIRQMVELCARLALGPSIAIFEPGFLRHALGYWKRGGGGAPGRREL
jgi:3-keto-5-aminohexanoate cleavage enzyme